MTWSLILWLTMGVSTSPARMDGYRSLKECETAGLEARKNLSVPADSLWLVDAETALLIKLKKDQGASQSEIEKLENKLIEIVRSSLRFTCLQNPKK